MTTNGCIVHARKNISNFNAAVNQLRREKRFTADVFQQLPKRCCSCNGKLGIKTINLERLRKICDDIMLSAGSTLKFRFSSNMNNSILMKMEEPDSDQPDDETSEDSVSTGHTEVVHDECTSSNQETTVEDHFSKVLENFQITIATDGCIVHNHKYRSKFNYAVNLLYRSKKFKQRTYYELPKRCCSCNGKTGVNVIDLNVLISICDEIESIPLTKSILEKPFHVLTLSHEEGITPRECRVRICRFIGKKGEKLRVVQEKYNVHIHIIERSTRARLRQKLIKVQDAAGKEDITNAQNFYLIITRKNKLMTDPIPIDEIKQEINAIWDEASEMRFIEREFTFDHTEPNERFQFLRLSFDESALSPEERHEIIGRLIGKKGENLRDLGEKYNIYVHIVNGSSKEKYFRKIIKVQEKNEKEDHRNPNDIYLFITKKKKSITNVIPIHEVKEDILKKWKIANTDSDELHEEYHFLSLSFDSRLRVVTRRRTTGHFIGKKGHNLRALQDKYNIHIRIINESSNKKLRGKLAKVQNTNNMDKIHLLIMNRNKSITNKIPIAQIKQDITQNWNKLNSVLLQSTTNSQPQRRRNRRKH